MTSIIYIVPYFGKFPKLFPVWLHSCANNPTVNWLILTDDKRNFSYPSNVKVEYTTFAAVRERIQKLFDFEINLSQPYKLCDFRIAYGLAFADYIKGYDFWGFCDIDLIWGNIRNILNEEIFATYDKIGYQGHSTLFRNVDYINRLFRETIGSESVYPLLQSSKSEFTDEDFINRLFDYKQIPYYQKKTFANLSSFVYNFKLNHLEKKDKKKNKRFIFSYERGRLYRLSAVGNAVFKDEFMYVHFLKRDMNINIPEQADEYLIVPNELIPYENVDAFYINKADAPHALEFAIRHFKENAYKLNVKTIVPIAIRKIKGYFQLYTKF